MGAVDPSLARLRLWAAASVALGCLLLGGWIGWNWFQAWTQRREALALAEDRAFDAAEPTLRRLHERQPRDVEVVAALAVGYLRGRRLAEAEALLNDWCALRPGDVEPYRRRFELGMKQQRIEPAIADAEHLIRLNPADTEIRPALAQLLQLAGRYEAAELEARRCLQRQPDNQYLSLVLATACRSQGKTAEAIALADQMLRAAPKFGAALRLRAELYLDAQQPDAAIRLLQQAADEPGLAGAPALYELGLALSRAGRAEEAKKAFTEMHCRQAYALWSKDPNRDHNLGLQQRVVEAFLAAGKANDAIRLLTGILERNPRAEGARRLLAECYDNQGQPGRAAEQRRQGGEKP